jgi:predicted ATPase/class 3 adenylate cyclase
MFTDFAGFTSFASKQDIEDVHDHMSSLWQRLDAIITSYGGAIEKHIGDAIMAVFGAHQARESDPEQAVRAALAIQACLTQPDPDARPTPLQMRIGIHSGQVVIGPAGGAGEITITGDTVNLASRLEQSAPVGGILISEETYRLVYGLFDVQAQPPLSVRGKTDPVQTYFVVRARPRAVAVLVRGVEGVETQMIGREAELSRMQSDLRSVMRQRELRAITIVGEAGLGKSCLVREFQKWIDLLPQTVRLFAGRATAETAGLPYSLMRDVITARFEILESDSPAVARAKLEAGVASLIGASASAAAWSEEDCLLHAHFIGQLLGLDFSASPYLRDILRDPEQIRHRALQCLGRFFSTVSQGPPPTLEQPAEIGCTLLLVEDLHWSDDASLDLIAHLSRTCQGSAIMILGMARPSLFERRPNWGEGLQSHTRLHLAPLSRREGHSLVESILRKAPEVPQALRELVVGGAEGNPFFLEEIIKMLIDQKVIVPGPNRWRIEPDKLALARVPTTLTAVLQARLDGLTAIERTVLQRAAVVGREFWDSAVECLGSGPENTAAEGRLTNAELSKALHGLRAKELIFRRESSVFAGTVEYLFKHELMRNVAYESLLKKLRRGHHAQLAAWLIEHGGERIGEFAGLVAAHFEQAGSLAQAAEWFGRAGQQARAGYAPAAASEHFHKALALLPGEAAADPAVMPLRLTWLEGLGETLGVQARYAEAMTAYSTAGELAETLADLTAQARVANGQAFIYERISDNRSSIAAADRAESLARAAGEAGRSERIKALYLKGWALYRRGEAPAVLALAAQTLQLCQETGDRQGMAVSFKLYGVAHLQLGQHLEADRFFREGLVLCEELGDRRNSAAMWSNLGECARLRGDDSAAAELYEKALAIARQIGHRESENIYFTNLAGARLGLGEFAAVEADLRELISHSGSENTCSLAETYIFLAEACLGGGKLAPAFEAVQRGLALAKESENDLFVGCAWRTLGRVAAAGGRVPSENQGSAKPLADPEACFHESLRVFEQMNAEGEQARTLRDWAQLDAEKGDNAASGKKIAAASDIFRRLGMDAEVEKTGVSTPASPVTQATQTFGF